jgi:hypothetical protein
VPAVLKILGSKFVTYFSNVDRHVILSSGDLSDKVLSIFTHYASRQFVAGNTRSGPYLNHSTPDWCFSLM